MTMEEVATSYFKECDTETLKAMRKIISGIIKEREKEKPEE